MKSIFQFSSGYDVGLSPRNPECSIRDSIIDFVREKGRAQPRNDNVFQREPISGTSFLSWTYSEPAEATLLVVMVNVPSSFLDQEEMDGEIRGEEEGGKQSILRERATL
ncbi:hypothetical protein K0M31_008796, partial [Melipona bicolor]